MPERGVEGEEEELGVFLLMVTCPSRVTVANVFGGVVGLGGAGATGAGKITGSFEVEDVICFKTSVLGRTRLHK